MDTQVITLPETFDELLKTFIEKDVGLCCIKGKMVYFGTLKDVAKKCISLSEKGTLKTIPISYVCSLNIPEQHNFKPDSTFAKNDTELFRKYHNFMNQTVTIRRKVGNTWDETGIIKHIAKDYMVIYNDYDNALYYLYATVDLDIIPR